MLVVVNSVRMVRSTAYITKTVIVRQIFGAQSNLIPLPITPMF